jgi:hypothetical protein
LKTFPVTFPVTRLKIDKSFIDGLPANEDDKAVLEHCQQAACLAPRYARHQERSLLACEPEG